MRIALICGAAVITAAFAENPGIRPRPAASDYSASDSNSKLTVAASVLSSDAVQNTFATDLKRGYVVVEVAAYPNDKESVDLAAGDFALRAGGREFVRPSSPATIAAIVQRKNAGPAPRASDVTLYPTADVGVISGPGGRSVYTGAGVGVGIGGPGGPPPPASTDRDRDAMKQELEDKALPEGKFSKAVAGYLYFPIDAKRGSVAYELAYFGPAGKLRVLLPPANSRQR
jgi:hypothetical protein